MRPVTMRPSDTLRAAAAAADGGAGGDQRPPKVRGVPPLRCRLAFCAKDSKLGASSAGATGSAIGVLSGAPSGAPSAPPGVSGVVKPLGMKSPGGGVRPMVPMELPGDRVREVAAGVVERDEGGARINGAATGVNCCGWPPAVEGLRWRAASSRLRATALTEASASCASTGTACATGATRAGVAGAGVAETTEALEGGRRSGGWKAPRRRNSSSSSSKRVRRSVKSMSLSPKDVAIDRAFGRLPFDASPRMESSLAETAETFSSKAWPMGPELVTATPPSVADAAGPAGAGAV